MPIQYSSASANRELASLSTGDQISTNDRKHPKRCPPHLSVSLKSAVPYNPGPAKVRRRLDPKLGFDREASRLAIEEDSYVDAEKWFERSNKNAAGNRVISLPNSKLQMCYTMQSLTIIQTTHHFTFARNPPQTRTVGTQSHRSNLKSKVPKLS